MPGPGSSHASEDDIEARRSGLWLSVTAVYNVGKGTALRLQRFARLHHLHEGQRSQYYLTVNKYNSDTAV